MLSALSPLDGRYAKTVSALSRFFSEEALHRARVLVEVRYLLALADESKVKEFRPSTAAKRALLRIAEEFSPKDAQSIAKIEEETRHDIKAVEYFLKERVKGIPGLKDAAEFVHFALTSEDTNNIAYGLLIHQALKEVIVPSLEGLTAVLEASSRTWKGSRMLSLTHGQPATPTTMDKELLVTVSRLMRQIVALKSFRMCGKFGGAVGNMSAHRAAYPDIHWDSFAKNFVQSMGLTYLPLTTQINPHDDLGELSHLLCRINAILLGFSRDLWMYVSRGVFRQKAMKGEVGSSTMPHKVNPIDFENAEGNLGLSSALFSHFAEKLPISRLQRDLSDSTVQRNIGVAFGHHLLAVASLRRGLPKLELDHAVLQSELDRHPEVAAEAIQTVLRKHGIAGAYEKLKSLTRGEKVTKESLRSFVRELKIPTPERDRLLTLL